MTTAQVAQSGGADVIARGAPGHGRLSWLIVAMFAVMPLAWRSPLQNSLGSLRYAHLPAVILVVGSARSWMPLARRMLPFASCVVAYSVAYAAFEWYHSAPLFAVQQGFYIGAAFATAAVFRAAGEGDWRILRWCGPAAVATYLFVFFLDARVAGVNVLGTYAQAVTHGQLQAVQFQLFGPVFNAHLPPGGPGEAAAVLPNISHNVFAAVLVAMLVSIYACTVVPPRGALRVVHRTSVALGCALIALSLSRSVLLVSAVACLFPIVRRVILGRVRSSDIYTIVLVGLALTLVATTPLLGFLSKRVNQDTASYSARGSAVTLAIDSIARSPLTGTNRYAGVTRNDIIVHPEEVASHNFILEAAVTGGLLTGMLALMVYLIALRDLVRTFGVYLRDRSLLAPLAGGAMALIWMFTVAQLNQPEWSGLALFYAAASRLDHPRRPVA